MSNQLISDGDLNGFDLKNYADLDDFSYRQWRDLMLHRSVLWGWAKTWKETFRPGTDPFASDLASARRRATELGLGDACVAAESRFSAEALQAEVMATVTALLGSPLTQTFALPSYLESGNPLATAAIRLRPQPYAGIAPLEPDEFNAALFGAVDDVPVAQAYVSMDGPRQILLEVDIDAPNEQLISDFRRWLRMWRRLTQQKNTGIGQTSASPGWIDTSINRWVRYKLVPYIDLKLVSRFLRRDFPNRTLGKKLGFPDSEWDRAEERLERYVEEFLAPK
ncbi:hypothetical protein BZM26_12750 [Paraburkholderia strydomiana]|nr:hypothetical protein BZM26_12750 [Paraburkholderia strydomiana]